MNSEASENYIDHSGIDHDRVFTTMLLDSHEINQGDLSSLEKRLAAQAVTTDAIFTSLAGKAAVMIDYEGFTAAEKCLKLALKAQAQSAHTMKVLAEIKQPKHVTIANQANIANQQQVNNGYSDGISKNQNPHAEEKKLRLSEKNDNELIQINEVRDAALDARIKKKTC